MLPSSFTTSRLYLRPIEIADAKAVFDNYAQDSEVTKFLIWKPHKSFTETESYIANCVSTSSDVARTYVLTGRNTQKVIGALDIRQATVHRLEFGYVLERASWKAGLMTEILSHIVSWALSQKDIFRIGAFCDVENIASARVMEKSGLIQEGLMRKWLVHPNISNYPRDCFSYGAVKTA
jgi:RimJ/RimL family protein N-acetyltransferase